MVPQISDRIVEIDQSMRWGYVHKLGPFELWDALGFQDVAKRLQKEGRVLPKNVQEMLASGATSFYSYIQKDGRSTAQYFDFGKKSYQPLDSRAGTIVLADVKRAKGVVKKNAGASLIDLGDGVLCCEFHSKMNSIGEDILSMLFAGLEETNKNF